MFGCAIAEDAILLFFYGGLACVLNGNRRRIGRGFGMDIGRLNASVRPCSGIATTSFCCWAAADRRGKNSGVNRSRPWWAARVNLLISGPGGIAGAALRRSRPARPGGKSPKLTPRQDQLLKARLDAGPTDQDGVCTLRGINIVRIIKEQFDLPHEWWARRSGGIMVAEE